MKREDLRHLRRCIKEAVLKGEIQPIPIDPVTGQGDPFDPEDGMIGPNMYNVVNNFIQPLTKAAGRMSWALLRHPEGLKCDLFITHGWSEGSAELIDKILASWPPGKVAAWCCIFANPQNLDISDLIREPCTSPFAKALNCSSHMMVVSNGQMSIYTRVWCVYEAYLAYTWGKTIFTAVAPHTREKVVTASIVLASLLSGLVIGKFLPAFGDYSWTLTHPDFPLWYPEQMAVVSLISALTSQSMSRPRVVCQTVNIFGIVVTSISMCVILTHCWLHRGTVMFHGHIHWHQLSFWAGCILKSGMPAAVICRLLQPLLLVYFMLSELDSLRAECLREEARQLAQFSSILHAASTSESDKQAIMSDIGDRVEAVDKSIRILLAAGMSTLQLRSAAERGVDVAGAADQRYAIGWAGVSIWGLITVYFCNGAGLGVYEGGPFYPLYFSSNVVCLVAYVLIGICSESDKRAFLLSALLKIEALMALFLPFWAALLGFQLSVWELMAPYTTVISVVAILCATAGMSGLAKIPCFGRCLAGTLSPGCRCCQRCRRGSKRHQTDADAEGTSSESASSEGTDSEGTDLEGSASEGTDSGYIGNLSLLLSRVLAV